MRRNGTGSAGAFRQGTLMSDPATNVDRLLELAGAVCDNRASPDDLIELDAALLRRRNVPPALLEVLPGARNAGDGIAVAMRTSEAAGTGQPRFNVAGSVGVRCLGGRNMADEAETVSSLPHPRQHHPQHGRLLLLGLAGGVSDGNSDFRARAVDRLLGACVPACTGRQAIRPSPLSLYPSPRRWLAGSPAWSIANGRRRD